MKVTTKGQVTIPQAIRKRLGVTSHTEVDFVVKDDRVVLVAKKNVGKESKCAEAVGVLSNKWTTAQIMKITHE